MEAAAPAQFVVTFVAVLVFAVGRDTRPYPVATSICLPHPGVIPSLPSFSTPMSQPVQKLTSPMSIAVDAVLTIAFFVFMYWIVAPHVPSNDKSMVLLWGGLCSACMAGVFWLCIQMFRVVLQAQRADRRK